jgi:hypothetical protein
VLSSAAAEWASVQTDGVDDHYEVAQSMVRRLAASLRGDGSLLVPLVTAIARPPMKTAGESTSAVVGVAGSSPLWKLLALLAPAASAGEGMETSPAVVSLPQLMPAGLAASLSAGVESPTTAVVAQRAAQLAVVHAMLEALRALVAEEARAGAEAAAMTTPADSSSSSGRSKAAVRAATSKGFALDAVVLGGAATSVAPLLALLADASRAASVSPVSTRRVQKAEVGGDVTTAAAVGDEEAAVVAQADASAAAPQASVPSPAAAAVSAPAAMAAEALHSLLSRAVTDSAARLLGHVDLDTPAVTSDQAVAELLTTPRTASIYRALLRQRPLPQ